jgi:hypothetical protein
MQGFYNRSREMLALETPIFAKDLLYFETELADKLRIGFVQQVLLKGTWLSI